MKDYVGGEFRESVRETDRYRKASSNEREVRTVGIIEEYWAAVLQRLSAEVNMIAALIKYRGESCIWNQRR